MSLRKYWKLGLVAAACALLGAGASVIASAGAATSAPTKHAGKGRGFAGKRLGRAVHGEVVVPSKGGFVTVTFDKGIVKSVSGQQLTLTEGTKTATYKTVTLTIPAGARVRDNHHAATLADVRAGQRAKVIQTPTQTYVIAHDVRGG